MHKDFGLDGELLSAGHMFDRGSPDKVFESPCTLGRSTLHYMTIIVMSFPPPYTVILVNTSSHVDALHWQEI